MLNIRLQIIKTMRDNFYRTMHDKYGPDKFNTMMTVDERKQGLRIADEEMDAIAAAYGCDLLDVIAYDLH